MQETIGTELSGMFGMSYTRYTRDIQDIGFKSLKQYFIDNVAAQCENLIRMRYIKFSDFPFTSFQFYLHRAFNDLTCGTTRS